MALWKNALKWLVSKQPETTVMPPNTPNEIVVSEIVHKGGKGKATNTPGIGAWASVGRNDMYRIPL